MHKIINNKILSDFKNFLEKKYPIFIYIELDYNKINDQYLNLGLLEIFDCNKNKGIGTMVMYEIISFSNKNNIPIALTPTHFFGCEINRLIKFYQRFGFVINEKFDIFDEKMLYLPK